MGWSQHERERYEREVLEPARASRRMPEDLFLRYAITEQDRSVLSTDRAKFGTHVAEVCKYWRSKQRGVFKKIARDLVAAHEDLERSQKLTYTHFDNQTRAAKERARRELHELAQSLTTSHIDHNTLGSLAETVLLPHAEVERALHEHGVRVVAALPELPTVPPIPKFSALQEHLRTRGADFSPMVVFGTERVRAGFTVLHGFRLADGSRLEDAALQAAGRTVEVEAFTDRKTAAESVLGILRAEPELARRDAVVLWEILTDLRQLPSGIAERGLAHRWVRRGLDKDEADILAAAVRAGGAGTDARSQAETHVPELLAGGQLRAAERHLPALDTNHPLAEQVHRLQEQIGQLSQTASRQLQAGQSEEAAHTLVEAGRLASDDTELAERLARIPPRPPTAAHASARGAGVHVSWQHSPSEAGGIAYQVRRRYTRAGEVHEEDVATATETTVEDPQPPVGVGVRYHVRAVRGRQALSTAVATSTVAVTPDVTNLSIAATSTTTVTGSWSVTPQATGIEVLRGEDRPPRGIGEGIQIPARRDGFQDSGVRPGRTYHYVIRAVYAESGGRQRTAAGLVRAVTPDHPPEPVRDLAVDAVEHTGSDLAPAQPSRGCIARWSPPERGTVVLRLAPHAPPWPSGAVVSHGEARSFGQEVARAGEPELGGRMRVDLPLPSGRHVIVPIVELGEQSAVGDWVTITNTAPVRDLRAERFDTQVRLRWTWPQQATTALVRWTTPEGASAEQHCDRHRYTAEGGFEAPMYAELAGYADLEATAATTELTVTVRASSPTSHGTLWAPPAAVRLPAIRVVDYRITRSGPLGRNRRVVVTVPRTCTIPELLVVHAAGRVQPHAAEQGQVLERIPSQQVAASAELVVTVRPPRSREPSWLMCFVGTEPERSENPEVRLRQPSVRELRL